MIDFEKENQCYFSDRKHGKATEMVEYWQPTEQHTWQAAPKIQRPLKIPKVKEPKDQKDGRKNTSDSPSFGTLSFLFRATMNTREKFSELFAKGTAIQAKLRANKVAPIHTKVQARHLEMEPLCCLSSCLVRGGCTAVIAFEVLYVVLTMICILAGMCRGGFSLWEPLPHTINEWIGHHIIYYSIAIYDLVTICMALMLSRGLFTFDKGLVHIHLIFCFVSLAINSMFLIFFCWALSTPGPFTWSIVNTILVSCFSMQIPLQIWAITVVKSCQDFFALIHVFVTLADA